MSSILTNTGAMTALRVLRQARSAADDVQSMVSTGLSVADARDDAATWSISRVMNGDAIAFEQIGDGLRIGAATVAVGERAAESIVDLMAEMKQKVIAATQENVDRAKLGTDIAALRDQIGQIVASAQFNGLNLVDNTYPGRDEGTELLASLDRGAQGVETRRITVVKQDLSLHEEDSQVWNSVGIGRTVAANERRLIGTVRDTESPGSLFRLNSLAGMQLERPMVFGHGGDHEQTLRDIRDGMEYAAEALGLPLRFDYETTPTETRLYVTNTGASDVVLLNVDLEIVRFGPPTPQTRVPGRLSLLNHVKVDTPALARASLQVIERKIDYVTDAASSLGSVANRIDTQQAFVSQMAGALRTGIGALVDADMEEMSAMQQALQAQGELAGQSLSIANSTPQVLLGLFQ